MDADKHPHETEPACDHVIKILLVGDEGVGKSSLLRRFCKQTDINPDHRHTIGAGFDTRCMDVNGKLCKFQVYDTAEKEWFREIIKSYFGIPDVVLFCYDVTEKNSFRSCGDWLVEVKYFAPNSKVIVVGNKQDVHESEWEVNRPQFSEHLEVTHLLCSAKSGFNVENIFSLIARNYMGNPIKNTVEKDGQFLDLEREESSKVIKERLVDQLRKNVCEFHKNKIQELATKVKSECIKKSNLGKTGHVVDNLSRKDVLPLMKKLEHEGLEIKRGDCPCNKHSFNCECPRYIVISWGGVKRAKRVKKERYTTLY